jgi:uncharacterized protein (DUF2267 family)
MSYTGLTEFDNAVQKTNVWLKDLMERMVWRDRHRAYSALRVVLHALRDHLTVDEAVALGAQLPMLVRGFYYEGWKPADKPLKQRKQEAFVSQIAEGLRDPDIDADLVARAVFQVLTDHLTIGEVEGIKHCLPKEIRELWSETRQTA